MMASPHTHGGEERVSSHTHSSHARVQYKHALFNISMGCQRQLDSLNF